MNDFVAFWRRKKTASTEIESTRLMLLYWLIDKLTKFRRLTTNITIQHLPFYIIADQIMWVLKKGTSTTDRIKVRCTYKIRHRRSLFHRRHDVFQLRVVLQRPIVHTYTHFNSTNIPTSFPRASRGLSDEIIANYSPRTRTQRKPNRSLLQTSITMALSNSRANQRSA